MDERAIAADGTASVDDIGPDTVVLVEGDSDRIAVERLAIRLGLDLVGDSVTVVSMGGATSVGRYMARYGPNGMDARLAGLCDVAETAYFERALIREGIRQVGDPASLEHDGFFVCVADLEDELIRNLGVDAVVRVIGAQGDLDSFRILQQQPAQRDRAVGDQLRRFMGTRSGRKAEYALALVDALDLDRVPAPLSGLIARLG